MKKPLCSFYLSLTPDLHQHLKQKLQRAYRVDISQDTLTTNNLNKNTEILGTFVDSKISSWQIDEDKILKSISSRTKAILIPHIYGQTCEMIKLIGVYIMNIDSERYWIELSKLR